MLPGASGPLQCAPFQSCPLHLRRATPSPSPGRPACDTFLNASLPPACPPALTTFEHASYRFVKTECKSTALKRNHFKAQFSGLQYTHDVVQTPPLVSSRTFHHIPEDLAPGRHGAPACSPAPGTHQPASCLRPCPSGCFTGMDSRSRPSGSGSFHSPSCHVVASYGVSHFFIFFQVFIGVC